MFSGRASLSLRMTPGACSGRVSAVGASDKALRRTLFSPFQSAILGHDSPQRKDVAACKLVNVLVQRWPGIPRSCQQSAANPIAGG